MTLHSSFDGPSTWSAGGSRRSLLKLAGGAAALAILRPTARAAAISLFDGKSLDGWTQLQNGVKPAPPEVVSTAWTVKDGAIASTGSGRGVLYSAGDYGRFRLTFTMRHVSGDPDHQACVLIFCTRPQPGERPLDALGGIQFQVPNGGHWDYRPGRNDAGNAEFTKTAGIHFDPHEWSRVEIVADASQGTARMTVAQPLGSKPVEVLQFRDPAAGKLGPIALQMHNAGLFDEYKDLAIEVE